MMTPTAKPILAGGPRRRRWSRFAKRTSPAIGASLAAAALFAVQACGGTQAEEPPVYVPVAGTSQAGSGVGGNLPAGGSGGNTSSQAGTAGTVSAGTGPAVGGMAGSGGVDTGGSPPVGGTAGTGGGGAVATGHFKMLVYYETRAYVHPSIAAGINMMEELGAANDFEVVISDGEQDKTQGDENIITPEGLASFDMLFFMNTTGDIFTDAEQQVVIDFLHEKKAFGGVHAATDTEHTWTWYEELVGEIYDGHAVGTPSSSIQIEDAMKNHPAMAGIQNPWTRNEEWYRFGNRITQGLPGLQVLMRFGGPTVTEGPAVGQPLAWVREWEGIRSFYTAMGHAEGTYTEPDIKKHVLGGVLWAARRLEP